MSTGPTHRRLLFDSLVDQTHTPSVLDGRHMRAERGKEAVVDAMLTLYAEGNLSPGAAEIGIRAGVSQRSVFRYFQDLDSLAVVAIAKQIEKLRPGFALPPIDNPLTTRIADMFIQRVRIHSLVAPTMRACGHSEQETRAIITNTLTALLP